MKEFVKLDKYGQLYIDKILFESYFPIIFTCLNDNNDIFICVCCQNNEKGCKWLLGKTNGISIVKMLQDEITVRQLLLEYSSGKISADYAKNGYVVAYNNSDWDTNSPYLPKEDSYMYAEDGEFEEEIYYFLMADYHVHYNAEYYKCIVEALEPINNEIGAIVDVLEPINKSIGQIVQALEPINKELKSITNALAVFVPVIGKISISSEVVRTLKVFGELCTNFVVNTEKYTDQEKYKPLYNSTFSVLSEDLNIKVESDESNYADAA